MWMCDEKTCSSKFVSIVGVAKIFLVCQEQDHPFEWALEGQTRKFVIREGPEMSFVAMNQLNFCQ